MNNGFFYSKASKKKKKPTKTKKTPYLKAQLQKPGGRKGAQNFCPIQVEAFKCAVKVEV